MSGAAEQRSTCFLSPPMTSAPRPRRRVRLLDFFSSRCERNALRRRILPVPVTLKRLAAPRCVFIFGISSGSVVVVGRRRRSFHRVAAAVDSACRLRRRSLGLLRCLAGFFVGCSTIVMLRPSWRGGDSTIAISATSSAIRWRIFMPSSGWAISRPRNMIVSLTLLPSPRKRIDVLHLGRVVVLVDLGPELHLLDDDVRGLALRLPCAAVPARRRTAP